MLTNEEYELRRSQVGASDVPKLFNFDTKGSQDLFDFKIGLATPTQLDNKYITFGNITEEVCLRHYLDKGSYTLNNRIEHKYIKNFVSSLDAFANDVPIENKSMKKDNFDKLTKPLPIHYKQVQAQISCTQATHGIIVYNSADDEDYEHPILYSPEGKQKVYKIERDEKMIKEIESRVGYFLVCMNKNIKPNEKQYKLYAKAKGEKNE